MSHKKKFSIDVRPNYDAGFRYFLNYGKPGEYGDEVKTWHSRPSKKEIKKAVDDFKAEMEHVKTLSKGL